MKESIHGHEVMFMMAELPQPFTQAALLAAIEEKFGTDARFHTCSAENMSAAELINFLEARGKFTGQKDSLSLDKSKICNHG